MTNPGNNANHGGYIDFPYYRTVVGEFELSDSPYGTFDQGGNVWEWNETEVFSLSRGVRGGSFDYFSQHLGASLRGWEAPADESLRVGFRVASSIPEPGSLTLCIAGVAMLMLRRGRK